MPSTKIKWGNWVDLRPGQLRVNWGGWFAPRLVYVKDQNGVWRDTGYSSAPGPPINLGVSAWSYSSVTFVWNGPSAGAGLTAPHHYEYVITDANGNWYHNPAYTTTGGTATYSVSADTRYRFYVRSVSAAGLVSGWVESRIGIGHPSQTAQRWAQRSRPWQSGEASNWQYNGTIIGQTAPAYSTAYGFATGVVVADIRMNFWSPAGFTHTLGLGRDAYYLWNSTAGSPYPAYQFSYPIPHNGWYPHPARGNWSNGGYWGIWLTGSGWDDKYGTPPFWSYVLLSGTEYYPELENYTSVAEAGNYTW